MGVDYQAVLAVGVPEEELFKEKRTIKKTAVTKYDVNTGSPYTKMDSTTLSKYFWLGKQVPHNDLNELAESVGLEYVPSVYNDFGPAIFGTLVGSIGRENSGIYLEFRPDHIQSEISRVDSILDCLNIEKKSKIYLIYQVS